MNAILDLELPSAEDVALGQTVIVAARWVLVATAFRLAIVEPKSLSELRVQLLVIIFLAVCNFALHSQLLRRRPAIDTVAFAASAADIAVISILVLNQGGYRSELYVFYLPALFAMSLSFGLALTTLYTVATVALYASVASLTVPVSDVQDLVLRCLMLGAVALCGAMYFHIEQGRRSAARKARAELNAQIRERAQAREQLVTNS